MSKQINVDEKVLSRLKAKIMIIERENYKTKKYDNTQMVERILKMIKEDANNVNK